jgi:hypothetical protein
MSGHSCWGGVRPAAWLALALLVLAPLTGAAGELPDAGEIRTYITGVQELAAEIADPPGADQSIKAYLDGCVARATGLLARATATPLDRDALLAELRRVMDERNRAKNTLGELTDRGRDLLRKENRQWPALGSFLRNDYLEYLVVKRELLERKYFEEDDPAEANLLEGWVNGRVGFLQYRERSQAWYRSHGVSAWEVTVRTEPVVVLSGSNDAAVLFAGGLLYNFFPDVSQREDDPFTADVTGSFLSKQVKRVGLRAGAGAVFDGEGPDLLLGLGLQVRAISLWGTYQPEDTEWSLAVGISEWDWVKKLRPFLPYFGR